MASHGGEGGDAEFFGPQPLLRHGDDGKLVLRSEGLNILRRASAPVHVVFAIGGSRCGKSTASNALAFGSESPSNSRFETGDTFEPVTAGVDVAVRSLHGGGALVMADCEGAFHIGASSKSARGFGALGLLAYYVSSVILHVTMGSIDERDVEVLGFLAASSSGDRVAGDAEEAVEAVEAPEAPTGLAPPMIAPSLILLVNGARFDLGEAVARRLLRPPEEGGDGSGDRWSARSAIARGFTGRPALEALPACEHEAYWPKVNALRSRLLDSSPVMLSNSKQASGSHIADRLVAVVDSLNGDGTAANALALCEPAPATEALYRTTRLEPLVEEIARRFASGASSHAEDAGRGAAAGSPCSVDEALAEYDQRVGRLVMADAGHGEVVGNNMLVRDEVVTDMRARLAARLQGICEAVARGRQQASQQLRHPERETPSSPGDGKCGSLSLLEDSLAEAENELTRVCAWAEQEISALQDTVSTVQRNVAAMAQRGVEFEQKATLETKRVQDRWQQRLNEVKGQRSSGDSAQTTTINSKFNDLAMKINELSLVKPYPTRIGDKLKDFRDGLQAGRLKRQEVGSGAAQALDKRLQRFRKSVEQEATCLAKMREDVARRLSEGLEELRSTLEEEKCQRRDRHSALAQVVERVRSSLEAASVEVPSKPKRPSSASRPVKMRPRAGAGAADAQTVQGGYPEYGAVAATEDGGKIEKGV